MSKTSITTSAIPNHRGAERKLHALFDRAQHWYKNHLARHKSVVIRSITNSARHNVALYRRLCRDDLAHDRRIRRKIRRHLIQWCSPVFLQAQPKEAFLTVCITMLAGIGLCWFALYDVLDTTLLDVTRIVPHAGLFLLSGCTGAVVATLLSTMTVRLMVAFEIVASRRAMFSIARLFLVGMVLCCCVAATASVVYGRSGMSMLSGFWFGVSFITIAMILTLAYLFCTKLYDRWFCALHFDSTIVGECIGALGALSNTNWHSVESKVEILSKIETIAAMLGTHFPRVLSPGDAASHEALRHKGERCAAAVRQWNMWVITPMNSTQGELIKKLKDLLLVIVDGEWDRLPEADPINVSRKVGLLYGVGYWLTTLAIAVTPIVVLLLVRVLQMEPDGTTAGLLKVGAVIWAVLTVLSRLDNEAETKLAMLKALSGISWLPGKSKSG